jgi:hypothetical protein
VPRFEVSVALRLLLMQLQMRVQMVHLQCGGLGCGFFDRLGQTVNDPKLESFLEHQSKMETLACSAEPSITCLRYVPFTGCLLVKKRGVT